MKKTGTAVPTTVGMLKSSSAYFAAILLVVAGLMSVVFLLGEQYGVSVRDLTRDQAAITGYPAYLGFISQFGILLWAASAAICFLGYMVLSRHERKSANAQERKLKWFLLWSGFVTLMLGVDDAFMLHDRVFPHFGIHELVVYSAYAGAMLAYLVVFMHMILKTQFLLLLAALSLFGLSVLCDLIYEPKYSPFWFEDGTKIAGVLCWLVYYFRTVGNCLQGCFSSSHRAAFVSEAVCKQEGFGGGEVGGEVKMVLQGRKSW